MPQRRDRIDSGTSRHRRGNSALMAGFGLGVNTAIAGRPRRPAPASMARRLWPNAMANRTRTRTPKLIPYRPRLTSAIGKPQCEIAVGGRRPRTVHRAICLCYMASSSPTRSKAKYTAAGATLAKTLAPEEIRRGDFVTPLHVIAEVPSFYWCGDCWSLPHDEPVRIRFTPTSDGLPLKVKSVCLPFVLVKQASGERLTLDLRKCQLARLDRRYAKRAWKACRSNARLQRRNRCN